jgi:hypothetical protein
MVDTACPVAFESVSPFCDDVVYARGCWVSGRLRMFVDMAPVVSAPKPNQMCRGREAEGAGNYQCRPNLLLEPANKRSCT